MDEAQDRLVARIGEANLRAWEAIAAYDDVAQAALGMALATGDAVGMLLVALGRLAAERRANTEAVSLAV